MNIDFVKELEAMRDAYSEKRSDVADNITDILNGKGFNPELVEHRFAEFEVPADTKVVVYDTLTTMLSVLDPATRDAAGDAIGGEYY